MKNNLEGFLYFIGIIILIVMLLGYPLYFLWNQLMPSIFGLRTITFWEAVGLNLMAAILFRPTTTIKNKD